MTLTPRPGGGYHDPDDFPSPADLAAEAEIDRELERAGAIPGHYRDELEADRRAGEDRRRLGDRREFERRRACVPAAPSAGDDHAARVTASRDGETTGPEELAYEPLELLPDAARRCLYDRERELLERARTAHAPRPAGAPMLHLAPDEWHVLEHALERLGRLRYRRFEELAHDAHRDRTREA